MPITLMFCYIFLDSVEICVHVSSSYRQQKVGNWCHILNYLEVMMSESSPFRFEPALVDF